MKKPFSSFISSASKINQNPSEPYSVDPKSLAREYFWNTKLIGPGSLLFTHFEDTQEADLDQP